MKRMRDFWLAMIFERSWHEREQKVKKKQVGKLKKDIRESRGAKKRGVFRFWQ